MADTDAIVRAGATLSAYFRLLDERRFEAAEFERVFAVDGEVRRPNGTALTGPAAIAAGHAESFARFGRTQHLLTNHEITGTDPLTLRANLLAMHVWGESPSGVLDSAEDFFLAGAVITAELVATADGLRLRRVVNDNVWKAGGGFAGMAGIGRPPS